MANPLFVMFLSTRIQTVLYHGSLELRDNGIENFKILSTLFSCLHRDFAFHRSLGHEDPTTSAAVPVAAQEVTFSFYH